MSLDVPNLLAIVFSDQEAARKGVRVLYELEKRGEVEIKTVHVLKKEPSGDVVQQREDDDFPPPSGTLAGLAVGGILGLLGGPVTAAASAGIGALAGLLRDLYASESHADFVAEVSAALAPGKYVILAEAEEHQTILLDDRMRPLGGVVFRTTKRSVIRLRRTQRASEFKAQVSRLIADLAQSEGKTEERIQQVIDRARTVLKHKLESERSPVDKSR